MKSVFDHITGDGPLPENFKAAGKLSLADAFAVYRNGYVARLTEALGEIYGVVWKVLGDELFFQSAHDFVSQNPSESYNLGDYSELFVGFLQNHEVTLDFPFLPDLARMSWLHKVVFNSAHDVGRTDQQMLDLLGEDGAKAKFVRAFALFKSEFCVYDLWNCLNEDAEVPSKWQIPQFVCLHKSAEGSVQLRSLNEASFQALQDLQSGKEILDACENLDSGALADLFYFLTAQKLLL